MEVEIGRSDDALKKIKATATKKKGRGFIHTDEAKSIQYDEIESQGVIGPAKSVEGWIVFVSGIHKEATDEDVHNAFADYGTIKNLHLNIDRRTGYVKGYALIEFENYKDAEKAIKEKNGSILLEQKLTVDWAFITGPIDNERK